MEIKRSDLPQLFLRIALSASFLSAVADRFSLWGQPGTPLVSWGDWNNFVTYSNSVNAFVPSNVAYVLAIVATAFEIALPVFLLAGYKTRITAFISGTLLLLFAVAMTFSFGPKPALDYSVWTAAGAGFLLSTLSSFPYSVDHLLAKNKRH